MFDSYWQLLMANLATLGIDPDRPRVWTRLGTAEPGTRVVIAERDPRRFLDYLFAGIMQGCHIWLADPDWGRDRWRTLFEMARPHLVLGDPPVADPMRTVRKGKVPPLLRQLNHQHVVCIPTGGTSGGLRFAVHTWDTISAAASAFLEFFGEETHRAYVSLPLHHVSGLLPVVRAALSGGDVTFRQLPRTSGEATFDPEGFTVSVVPTQLQRLLGDKELTAWLARFQMVLLGGGPCDKALLKKARAARIRLAPSYGMTETAAMVAALRPSEFIEGQEGSGRALPHASLRIAQAAEGSAGAILIKSRSLALAYLPAGEMPCEDGAFVTGDLGFIDEKGSLHLLGRNDRLIISGGEKIDPAEVERVLLAHELVGDVFLVGQKDSEWGERLVAYYVTPNGTGEASIAAAAREVLAPYQVPKVWKRVARIPRNAVGKVEREALGEL